MKLEVTIKAPASPDTPSEFGPMRAIVFKHTTQGFLHLLPEHSHLQWEAQRLFGSAQQCRAAVSEKMKTVTSK